MLLSCVSKFASDRRNGKGRDQSCHNDCVFNRVNICYHMYYLKVRNV